MDLYCDNSKGAKKSCSNFIKENSLKTNNYLRNDYVSLTGKRESELLKNLENSIKLCDDDIRSLEQKLNEYKKEREEKVQELERFKKGLQEIVK